MTVAQYSWYTSEITCYMCIMSSTNERAEVSINLTFHQQANLKWRQVPCSPSSYLSNLNRKLDVIWILGKGLEKISYTGYTCVWSTWDIYIFSANMFNIQSNPSRHHTCMKTIVVRVWNAFLSCIVWSQSHFLWNLVLIM